MLRKPLGAIWKRIQMMEYEFVWLRFKDTVQHARNVVLTKYPHVLQPTRIR